MIRICILGGGGCFNDPEFLGEILLPSTALWIFVLIIKAVTVLRNPSFHLLFLKLKPLVILVSLKLLVVDQTFRPFPLSNIVFVDTLLRELLI